MKTPVNRRLNYDLTLLEVNGFSSVVIVIEAKIWIKCLTQSSLCLAFKMAASVILVSRGTSELSRNFTDRF